MPLFESEQATCNNPATW